MDLAGEILGECVGEIVVSIALEACAAARSQPCLGDSCSWKNVTSPPASLIYMSEADRMTTMGLALLSLTARVNAISVTQVLRKTTAMWQPQESPPASGRVRKVLR